MDMPDLLLDRERMSVHRSCRARDLLLRARLDTATFDGIWAYVESAGSVTAPALSKYLVSHGIPVSIDAIRRHRRRECACPDRKETDD